MITVRSHESTEIDFDKIDESPNGDAVHERCLEEISRLKARINSLETLLSRCEFKRWNQRNDQSDSKVVEKRVLPETESDIFVYSAFTLEKLFSPNSDVYHRNVAKLTGLRRSELRNVVEKSLEFLNSKPNRNYSIGDFQIGFTRSTPVDGFEYELHFKHGHQCCSQLKMRRAPQPDLELVQYSPALDTSDDNLNTESKKTINFILPLSIGDRIEDAFRLFLSSFESVVIDEDSSQATLLIAFQGSQTDFDRIDELVKEFKRRTRFEAVRFVRVDNQRDEFSRSKSIQTGVESLNCDPNDCLIFICDVDVLFNRNFLDLCRSNSIKGKRVFFPIVYSFYNPSMLSGKHLRPSWDKDSAENSTAETDDSTKLNLIINKETGFWRESGFGMACLHREDFRSVSGFSGFESSSWGGEDVFLFRKFARSPKIHAFRSITPGLFHLYHPKNCHPHKLTPRQLNDCLTAKILNEASHRDFGLIYFNMTQRL